MAHSKKKKSTETVSEKDLMEDILSKYFKTTVLKMFKELKEDVEKVREILCEQNGNTNKEIENLENNSGAEKYNNWNEKFTSGIQGRRKNQ